MKKSILSLVVLVVLASCGNAEKEAQARLKHADELYQNNQFSAAKQEIDSLKALYPKEFKVLKDALALMREVEIKEQERNIAYCDSLLPIRMEEAKVLIPGFVFEKDSAYDKIGRYVSKQQTIEKNIERCYIRAGVNEKGEMYLASVFYGKSPINHSSIRLSTKDSLFAETATIAYDGGNNYRFDDSGMKTEVVTYKGDDAADAVKFIYSTPEKERIKIEYKGDKPFVIYLADADRKAIRTTYELASLLFDIDKLNITAEKSGKKVAYLRSKLNKSAEK